MSDDNSPQLPSDLTEEQLDAISEVWAVYIDAHHTYHDLKSRFLEDKDNQEIKEEFRRAKVDLYVRRNAWRHKATQMGIIEGTVRTT